MITELGRQQVIDEAKTWLRTPYHHRASLKGVGVDCGTFPLAVYGSLNMLNSVEIPEYSSQWHLHQERELYLETVEALGATATIELRPANFVVFKIGRTFSHGAIIVQWPKIIHSLHPRGVIYSDALQEAILLKREMKVFEV